ncbi:hypothetical protein [Hyphomicrobium sp.]|jgi:hypothetical protein|uniref:hypothetical protein n=1 Tax=Hyphomicrobium sp. TaxID=82 RepID=UPI002B6AE222|nr:hypothetical protein [Hyphomicrobium sp.]HVZ04504.1 hypothetical protein [Hyphomicrobium sp.]
MRLTTTLSLIAVALPLSLAAGIGDTSLVSVAYAKSARSAKTSTHGSGWQPRLDDKKMNCKQLSGRVQVLILQLRGSSGQKKASGFSLGLHSAFASTVGTTATGSDPDSDNAADMRKLKDYNQRLIAMNCRSYDLNYELKQTDPNEMPAARVLPPKKSRKSN